MRTCLPHISTYTACSAAVIIFALEMFQLVLCQCTACIWLSWFWNGCKVFGNPCDALHYEPRCWIRTREMVKEADNSVKQPRNVPGGFLRCKGILDREWCNEIIITVVFCSYCAPENCLGDMLEWGVYYRNRNVAQLQRLSFGAPVAWQVGLQMGLEGSSGNGQEKVLQRWSCEMATIGWLSLLRQCNRWH